MLELVRGKLADAMPLILAHHYTARRTADPMHVFLWKRGGETRAAAVFCSPANRFFGKGAIELSRLVRVPDETAPMSQFLALCIRQLKQDERLAFLLSYADTTAGHHGGVYQASNFIYVAESKGNTQYRHNETGRIVSGRSFDQHAASNKDGWTRLRTGRKHLYIYPLREKRKALLARFGWTALPYPHCPLFD